MIEHMQSLPLDNLPPGPIGGTDGMPFQGCWFSEYGAGPFATISELEGWANHKLDICLRFHQAANKTPRFRFLQVALTHMDISCRNLILDFSNRVWLIDWGFAGVYPKGFEHAALTRQEKNAEFIKLVQAKLSSRHETEIYQLLQIQYGLTTAATA